MATKKKRYKPGEQVPKSGIYEVTHDSEHTDESHQVTCVKGHPFPPCNHCGDHPRFVLVVKARHIDTHKHFKKA